MKRSAPLKQSKILPRPWALHDAPQTKPIDPQSAPKRAITRSTPLVAKSPMKKSARPKSTSARKLAKGQDCTLMIPGCRNETETVVLCHLRQLGGGGMGIKPPENESAFGCRYCHDVADGRIPWVKDAPEDFNLWEHIAKAMAKTQRIMRAAGVLTMKGEEG
jgi:putative nuclease YbcO-like protein